MGKFIDLSGKKFGRLTAIERRGRSGSFAMWFCHCDCGGESLVRSGNLRSGNSTSCGCQAVEAVISRSKTHGQSVGYKSTPEHRAWKQALNRCRNPNLRSWKDYGGRGISMCPEWEASFQTFFDYVGPRPTDQHSLDRIDVDLGYQPGNVRWATPDVQNSNKRPRRTLVVEGEKLSVREASRRCGLNYKTVKHRLWKGWPDQKILLPARSKRPAALRSSS